MAHSQFDQFLQEATYCDQEFERTLEGDCFYGLYTSWSLIHKTQPETPEALRAGLQALGIDPDNNELSMTGPAAADYILASAPNLI